MGDHGRMGGQRDEVFTSGEVAKICGVSADTVSRWFDLGQLGGYRLGPGGDRRIPYDCLRQFMLSHGIPIDRLEAEQRRVLVVDDDPYYLDVLPSALSKSGRLVVYTASTGFDAGAMVAEQNPHLIILDIHLSDMDGRMVSQRVRARPETRNTRIIAISGFLGGEDAAELKRFGFDDYLQKPFSLQTLVERVHALLGPDASRARSGG